MKPIGGPQITIARKSGAAALMKRVLGVTKMAAYVGVPAASANARSEQLLSMAGNTKSKKKTARLVKAAKDDINNAELLFIFSKGSPVRHIPPRPVLEPAIQAQGNREPIARELAASVKASLAGDRAGALKYMRRASLGGQNAARRWFTDSRNGWAPNAASTIAAKGSDRPGIDTGAMRAAIVGVVAEE
jgi:hypothetical protein